MSKQTLRLKDLVEAIMNSISDAQNQLERQTMDNLNDWFDKDGRPKTTTFRVPSLHPDDISTYKNGGELIEREIEIPLLTLMQLTPIKIKRLLAKFDVSLGGVETENIDEKSANNLEVLIHTGENRSRKNVLVDLFTGKKNTNGNNTHASMEIEFEGGEPIEAFLKLQNELLKLF